MCESIDVYKATMGEANYNEQLVEPDAQYDSHYANYYGSRCSCSCCSQQKNDEENIIEEEEEDE